MNKHSGALARRYGTALYETLVELHKKNPSFSLEKCVEQFFVLSQVFTKDVISALSLPALTLTEKMHALKFLLGKVEAASAAVAPEISSFIEILISNQRLSEIQGIFQYFLSRADAHLGIVRASIVSARPLQENEKNEFESQLASALNKKIIFNNHHDESLKSGFVLKVGNLSLDASLRSRLMSLKELFI